MVGMDSKEGIGCISGESRSQVVTQKGAGEGEKWSKGVVYISAHDHLKVFVD